ncbi:MAG: Gfo/Idh/MocA family oxidoreductase, partial [Phycisphaeraceae bacterium]|nr:Gfo/Idh/MocA family oxidoreductase [Phycisphaeraceae bacterium]
MPSRKKSSRTTRRRTPKIDRSDLRVGLVGTGFMGRAHANAWRSAGTFFDLPRPLVMQAASGTREGQSSEFAAQWGWNSSTADWRSLVGSDDIDLVDVCTPNHLHAEMSIAA